MGSGRQLFPEGHLAKSTPVRILPGQNFPRTADSFCLLVSTRISLCRRGFTVRFGALKELYSVIGPAAHEV